MAKVTLDFTPEVWARECLRRPEVTKADGSRVDAAGLKQELDAIRRCGWGSSSDEMLIGVSALAAPVRDARGALAGTIAMIGASQMIPVPPEPETVRTLVAAAQRISRQLGYNEGELAA